MSFVPIVWVPLNIMCSKKWARPVIPGRSFAEPTWAAQAAATVVSSGRLTSRKRMPLSSSNSSTGTAAAVVPSCAPTPAGATSGKASASAATGIKPATPAPPPLSANLLKTGSSISGPQTAALRMFRRATGTLPPRPERRRIGGRGGRGGL